MALSNPPDDSFASDALLSRLKAQLVLHDKKYLCAFSGGLDSTALLHAAAQIPGMQLRAIHIHHGLHPEADRWAEHCRCVCRDLNIQLDVVKVDVKKNAGKGTEAAARHARYQAIAKNILEDEVLLTAHHLQDQAETILLRLLRGSGSQGLAAMRVTSSAHGFAQLRPLLSLSRANLKAYADEHNLIWIEDPSNVKTDFDRNYLRHEIMPLLEKRWPQAAKHLSHSAELLAEEHQCLREQAEVFLAVVQGIDKRTITVSSLMKYSKAWRAQILRSWTESLNAPLTGNILQEIEHSLLLAKPDSEAKVQWCGTEVYRWRDCLYLTGVQIEIPEHWQCPWNGAAELSLPNGARWAFVSGVKITDASAAIKNDFSGHLSVCTRQGGEKIRLANREHHSVVKNCLRELGVPPWERRQMPLFFDTTGECLAAGDVLLSGRFEDFCRSNSIRLTRIV